MGIKRGRWYGEDASEEIEYEKLRNARLAENRKRMEELGLKGLSQQLTECVRPCPALPSSRSSTPCPSPSPRFPTLVGPTRRSSRLQGSPVVSYTEATKKETVKEKSAGRRASVAGTGGCLPEIYTEEHEKLLGSMTKEWQLFVDGYSNGTRIYDPIRGKTCHQCRQKTMGQRTWCSSCKSLHGQFCGDCLYMRYGENVLEAKENEKWMCPVCRHICNCSFCRLKRGWSPTGALYKRIKSLGYKSVAHYLILTRQADKGAEGACDVSLQIDAAAIVGAPSKEEEDYVETQIRIASMTYNGEEKTLQNGISTIAAKEGTASLLTPKVDRETQDAPERIRETKSAVVTANDGMSSEHGEAVPKVKHSRRLLNYVSPLKIEAEISSERSKSNKIGAAGEEPLVVVMLSENKLETRDINESAKRGQGRPWMKPVLKKASFYTTRSTRKCQEVENPCLMKSVEEGEGEDSVHVLESDPEGSKMGLTSAPTTSLTIAQRLQR